MLEEYLWIFVVSVFLAIFVAWGIGANDVVSLLLLSHQPVSCAYNLLGWCRLTVLAHPSEPEPLRWDRYL